MEFFSIYTTIDITPSGVRNKTSADDWFIKRNQQRNYDTLLQVLGLRCQPEDIKVELELFREEALEFYIPELPKVYVPTKVWIMDFKVDRTGVLGKAGELFLDDIDGVPIVPALTETTPIFPPMFMAKGSLKNIVIIVEPYRGQF